MYQRMYELNTKYYRELTMYIIAGKKALGIAHKGKLEMLRIQAEKTENFMPMKRLFWEGSFLPMILTFLLFGLYYNGARN